METQQREMGIRDFRLPLRCDWDLRSLGILSSVEWAVSYRRFGTTSRTHPQGSSPSRWDR